MGFRSFAAGVIARAEGMPESPTFLADWIEEAQAIEPVTPRRSRKRRLFIVSAQGPILFLQRQRRDGQTATRHEPSL